VRAVRAFSVSLSALCGETLVFACPRLRSGQGFAGMNSGVRCWGLGVGIRVDSRDSRSLLFCSSVPIRLRGRRSAAAMADVGVRAIRGASGSGEAVPGPRGAHEPSPMKLPTWPSWTTYDLLWCCREIGTSRGASRQIVKSEDLTPGGAKVVESGESGDSGLLGAGRARIAKRVRRKWRKPYESEPEGREWANGESWATRRAWFGS